MPTYLIYISILFALLVIGGVVYFVYRRKRYRSQPFKDMVANLAESVRLAMENDSLLGDNAGYCMHSQVHAFREKYAALYDECKTFIPAYSIRIDETIDAQIDQIKSFEQRYGYIETARQEHNTQWTEKQLVLHQTYFDTLFKYPLDEQQRRAILSMDDHTLVVASAGSGKTSTIMGRTHYLKEKYGVPEKNILLVTYTHKAAEEMKSRLHSQEIEACTFHSLALKIIGQATKQKPDICKPYFFKEVMNDLLKTTSYKRAMIDYVMLYKNLVKNEHDYNSPSELFADRRKYGFQADYPDMDGHVIFTKSEQERQICNLLGIWGVRFRYEAPYEIDVRDEEHRQYKPDFTIFFTNTVGEEKHIYLEHFALNKGHVPKYFGCLNDAYDEQTYQVADEQYRAGVEWKRKTHDHYKTFLLETTSEEFYNNTIKDKLQAELKRCGIELHPLNIDATYQQLVQRDKYLERQVMDLVESFVSLMKAKRLSIGHIVVLTYQPRTRAMLQELVQPAYEEYERRLKELNLIDFTDAIIQATDILKQGYEIPWTDILVDEYQDIAIDRYEFLKQLHRNGTRLFCVGDDWQSIYRFSGSDINLMNHFGKWFPGAQICKIESTHRFGQPLVVKSSNFIMQNKNQLRKDVQCGEAETHLKFIGYSTTNQEIFYTVSTILKSIPEEESVYIIARYRFDVEALNISNNVQYDIHQDKALIYIGGRKIQFLTIHSAKGLEADHVIILNCSDKYFPSQITDDPLLDEVLSEKEMYPNAEERRVFYVGITRAKKCTYVLYDKDNPSQFVEEFIDVDKPKDERELCPWCHIGHLKVMKSGISKIGHAYQFVVCDNDRMGCPFKETRFFEVDSSKIKKPLPKPAKRIRTSEMRKAGYYDEVYARDTQGVHR